MPAEARKYIAPLIAEYKAMQCRRRPRPARAICHDCLDFASRAWRRPLTEKEKQSLRSFYDKTMTAEGDHDKAIRALLARILVSPAFLYRVEQPSEAAAAEAAQRLGYGQPPELLPLGLHSRRGTAPRRRRRAN